MRPPVLSRIWGASVLFVLAQHYSIAAEDPRAQDRAKMVEEQLVARGVSDAATLEAMRTVPRHQFVPADSQRAAYADHPLPIGYGQTISQPYVVGLMTQLLELKGGERVLEIGTGSGYQAAILTKVTSDVYTIEIIGGLQEAALKRLELFGLKGDRVIHGDGYYGLEKAAPFDRIIVTAGADHIPPPLLKQLKAGGRMVIPVGPVHATQRLVVVEKDVAGKVTTRSVLPVSFVPLTGGPRAGEKK